MAYQFPSSLSPQRVQSSASVPLKVPLRRGYSLMDWIRLTKSGADLRGVGPRMLHITEEELKKHNKPGDYWLAIRGFVYNVTRYVEYHPGGADELMKGVGIDATELFERVHRWVNYKSMLKACLVGRLEASPPSATKKTPAPSKRFLAPAAPALNSTLKSPNQPYLTPSLPRYSPLHIKSSKISVSLPTTPQKNNVKEELPTINIQVPSNSSTPNLNRASVDVATVTLTVPSPHEKVNTTFYQSSDFITLVCHTEYRNLTAEDVVCDLVDGRLFADIFFREKCVSLSVTLSAAVCESVYVTVDGKDGRVEIKLLKLVKDVYWEDIGTFGENRIDKKESFKIRYRTCVLKKKHQVSHDTVMCHFELPATCHMMVPIGRHVYFKATHGDVEVSRPYTVILPSLNERESGRKVDSRNFYTMIKIYDGGILTPVISDLKEGDQIEVGTYDGKFSVSRLDPYQNIVMLCAGTGFTPMGRILHHCLYNTGKSVHLWFGNKTQRDILWRDQLESLRREFPEKFSLDLVLSRPESSWSGRKGRISFLHLEELIARRSLNIQEDRSVLFLVCGSVDFSDITAQYLKDLNAKTSDIFAFLR